jgi:peptide/nickel transport system permease protein
MVKQPAKTRLRGFTMTMSSIFILGLVVLAILAPLIVPQGPFKSIAAPFQPPSSHHLLGTDDLGRSILAGLLYGARTSLLVGFSVTLVSFLIGVTLGGIAGFFGGWIDDVLMRFTELILILPRFFLALVVVALFGPSLLNVVLVLALTTWGLIARITRGSILSSKNLDYVLAARSLGRSELANLYHHVLPNVLAPIIAYAALMIGNAILLEASLSFLGLGDPNVMSWGYMLNNAQPFMRRAWWMSVFPGLIMAMTVLGVNLLNDSVSQQRSFRHTY